MFSKYYGIPKDVKMNDLMDRFPILFQDRNKSMRETCMCWGLEVPQGWWHILDQLCTVLEFHNIEFVKNHRIAIIADQVKEKFGTLRFYYTVREVDENGVAVDCHDELPADLENKLRIAKEYLDMLAQQYINEAEDMTYNTCAECGVPLNKENKVETKGWITYLCNECDEERQIKADEKENQNEEPAGKDSKAE